MVEVEMGRVGLPVGVKNRVETLCWRQSPPPLGTTNNRIESVIRDLCLSLART